MKTTIRILTLTVLLTAAALGQGILTPPGAPAPTMKTLLEIYNQIVAVGTQSSGIQTDATTLKGDTSTLKSDTSTLKSDTSTLKSDTSTLKADTTSIKTEIAALKDDARTPITAIPFTISAPGSYYLTGNFSVASGNGILISADNVTLDLNGFDISSTSATGSGTGISLGTTAVRKNIRIQNGSITGLTTQSAGVFTAGGFINGISNTSTSYRNITIRDIHVSNVSGAGITFGSFNTPVATIDNCNVNVCGIIGIQGQIMRNCFATDCGGVAISGAIVTDCTGISSGLDGGDHGISAQNTTNSRGTSNAGVGLWGTQVTNCHGISTSGNGLNGTIISNSTGTSSSGNGISGTSVTNSVGTSTTGSAGINATATASYCQGSRNGGTAISAGIAIGCTALIGTIFSTEKHLGTP